MSLIQMRIDLEDTIELGISNATRSTANRSVPSPFVYCSVMFYTAYKCFYIVKVTFIYLSRYIQ